MLALRGLIPGQEVVLPGVGMFLEVPVVDIFLYKRGELGRLRL